MKDRKVAIRLGRLVRCCSWDFFHIISLHDVIIVMLEPLWEVLWTCGRISVCSRSTHIVGSGDFNQVPVFVSSIGKMSVINIIDTADTNVHWHSAGFDSSQLTKYPFRYRLKKKLSAWSASQKNYLIIQLYINVCVCPVKSELLSWKANTRFNYLSVRQHTRLAPIPRATLSERWRRRHARKVCLWQIAHLMWKETRWDAKRWKEGTFPGFLLWCTSAKKINK